MSEKDHRSKKDYISKIEKLDKLWHSNLGERIQIWLDQFKNNKYDYREKFGQLLSKFLYFNIDYVRLLSKNLFYEHVVYPFIFREYNLDNSISETQMEGKVKKYIELCRFMPIGNPSESSCLISYFFRQSCELEKKNFQYFDNKCDDKNNYFFLDDICITGEQFCEYMKEFNIDEKHIIFLTLISSETAIKNIKKHTNIDTHAVCIIDDSYKLFSDNSRYFEDQDEKEEIKKTCLQMTKEYFNQDDLGFNDSQLALGFFYNTPDNTIQIFSKENDRFKPIFKRFEKK